ncbi:hypothetical protein BDY19DRAFT_907926 [Irpex rosettiformis]|uniref:Uncharacterized protein n=1 Tax=Irpex rosettiformis TaxID=378272 RepID=A0ACB8TXN5_9APHY|nr:hypothetical protein BDY19DRAFT_907926 [Irpex rosettiformis]
MSSGLSESDIQQLLLEYTFSCITFSQEVNLIWGRKWSATTWLYAFTRYNEVLLSIAIFLPISSLEAGQYTIYILEVTQFFCLGLFSALRVYALMDGKILVAGIVFLLSLVPVATNLFFFVTSSLVMNSEGVFFYVSLGTRISVIIGDVIILLVTWSKTAKSYYEARQLKIKAPLATLLFRDGTFYFIVLLILNVLQVIDGNVSRQTSYNTWSLHLIHYASSLPPLIVCRFILNLRQVKPAGSLWNSGSNAGESLRFGADEEDAEEENIVEDASEAREPDVLAVARNESGEDKADQDVFAMQSGSEGHV